MIEERLMRRPEVEIATGLSRATIYRLMSQGQFVRPYRTGKNSVRWRLSEVQKWIDDRPQTLGGWLLRAIFDHFGNNTTGVRYDEYRD